MDFNLLGLVDDFEPQYGLGIGYNVGNGKVSAKYTFSDSLGVEASGFTIGYTLGF